MPRDPMLVVIFLRGGADGLAMVCPSADANLIAARPEGLRVARAGDAAGPVLRHDFADTEFRLHPSAAPLADLYKAGDLSVIHAAGLTEATRSHFDAEARMERGLIGALAPGDPSGWLGRCLSALGDAGPLPALAVGTSRPASLLGAVAAVGESLPDLILANGHWLGDTIRNRLATGAGQHPRLAAPVAETLALSSTLAARLGDAPYAPATTYPADNPVSAPLMTVAQAIKLDLGLRVATVDMGGWDTHVAQSGTFAWLLAALSAALMAFWRDLGPLQQDVSVVVMSEFGRRLRANTAGGTDHGRANAMLVLGPQAKGGRMLGRWPGLANEALEEGADLAVTTDYRAVLAEVLSGHMRLSDAAAVFPGLSAAPPGLFGRP